jgi:hypothetical protein
MLTLPFTVAVYMTRAWAPGAGEQEIGRLTGLLAAVYSLSQTFTSYAWGAFSNTHGRKVRRGAGRGEGRGRRPRPAQRSRGHERLRAHAAGGSARPRRRPRPPPPPLPHPTNPTPTPPSHPRRAQPVMVVGAGASTACLVWFGLAGGYASAAAARGAAGLLNGIICSWKCIIGESCDALLQARRGPRGRVFGGAGDAGQGRASGRGCGCAGAVGCRGRLRGEPQTILKTTPRSPPRPSRPHPHPTPDPQGRVMSYMSLSWGVGCVVGPALGGLLSQPCARWAGGLAVCGDGGLLAARWARRGSVGGLTLAREAPAACDGSLSSYPPHPHTLPPPLTPAPASTGPTCCRAWRRPPLTPSASWPAFFYWRSRCPPSPQPRPPAGRQTRTRRPGAGGAAPRGCGAAGAAAARPATSSCAWLSRPRRAHAGTKAIGRRAPAVARRLSWSWRSGGWIAPRSLTRRGAAHGTRAGAACWRLRLRQRSGAAAAAAAAAAAVGIPRSAPRCRAAAARRAAASRWSRFGRARRPRRRVPKTPSCCRRRRRRRRRHRRRHRRRRPGLRRRARTTAARRRQTAPAAPARAVR